MSRLHPTGQNRMILAHCMFAALPLPDVDRVEAARLIILGSQRFGRIILREGIKPAVSRSTSTSKTIPTVRIPTNFGVPVVSCILHADRLMISPYYGLG